MKQLRSKEVPWQFARKPDMAHVELSTEMNASPQAAWDLTSDFHRIPDRRRPTPRRSAVKEKSALYLLAQCDSGGPAGTTGH